MARGFAATCLVCICPQLSSYSFTEKHSVSPFPQSRLYRQGLPKPHSCRRGRWFHKAACGGQVLASTSLLQEPCICNWQHLLTPSNPSATSQGPRPEGFSCLCPGPVQKACVRYLQARHVGTPMTMGVRVRALPIRENRS